MGIPGFNKWFYEENKQAYVRTCDVQVDHLYIDMNSVLHNVLRKGRQMWFRPHATGARSILCELDHFQLMALA
jgi:5'-3' exonuclease